MYQATTALSDMSSWEQVHAWTSAYIAGLTGLNELQKYVVLHVRIDLTWNSAMTSTANYDWHCFSAVEACSSQPGLVGKRVVGEINCPSDTEFRCCPEVQALVS